MPSRRALDVNLECVAAIHEWGAFRCKVAIEVRRYIKGNSYPTSDYHEQGMLQAEEMISENPLDPTIPREVWLRKPHTQVVPNKKAKQRRTLCRNKQTGGADFLRAAPQAFSRSIRRTGGPLHGRQAS